MKHFLLSLLLSVGAPALAAPGMADMFKACPDTLLPTLTANNRLDMIDFMAAGMRAEVTNKYGGSSVMTALTADSLSIQLSSVLRVDMKLLTAPDAPADSTQAAVRLTRTYDLGIGREERVVSLYTADWRLLSVCRESSTLLLRDDEVSRDDFAQ